MISPDLAVDFSLSESSLRVTYSVENRSDAAIYLFTTLWRFAPGGGIEADPSPFYVSLDGQGVLKLGKIIYPTPRLKLVEMTNIPLAHAVGPHETWSEILEVPVPIAEHSPYYLKGPSSTWESAQSRYLELWVSWIPTVEGLDVKPAAVNGASSIRHPQLLGLTQVLRSEPMPLRAPVRRRSDGFERF